MLILSQFMPFDNAVLRLLQIMLQMISTICNSENPCGTAVFGQSVTLVTDEPPYIYYIIF